MTPNSPSLKSPVLRESLWILAAFLITLAITYLFITLTLGNGALDIHLHDTYLVIEGKWFFWVAFPPLLFLICLARIFRKRNLSTLAYWVALASGLIMVIELSWLSDLAHKIFPGNDLTPAEAASDGRIADGLSLVMMALQLLALITLSWVAYQWGRRTQASHPITSPPPPSSSGHIP